MATFYVGPRPVLKGRTSANMVNPYTSMTGKAKGAGTYSYYPLYSTDHILDGAPDNDHTPGTGRHPGNVLLSQIFNGTTLYVHPLSGDFADGTATYDGARFRPKEYKGLVGSAAFPSTFGKANAYFTEYRYNNYIFDGVSSARVLSDVGHDRRSEEEGAPSSFGYFIPTAFSGVESAVVFKSGYGEAYPTGYDNEYGQNRVKEFRGVPSAKAL